MSSKKKNRKNKKIPEGIPKEFVIADIKDPNEHIMSVSHVFFRIEEHLGRSIKKYNLLICKKEGNHFTSSNNRLDAEIIRYIQKIESINMWSLGWMMKSKLHEEKYGSIENKKFFCMLVLDEVNIKKLGKLEATQFCYYGQEWEPKTD